MGNLPTHLELLVTPLPRARNPWAKVLNELLLTYIGSRANEIIVFKNYE